MKKMTTNSNMPSLEEIKLYHEGKLDATRTSAIDAEAAKNPFLAEALEGFAILPVFNNVPDVSVFLSSIGDMAVTASTASGGAAVTTSSKVAAWFGVSKIVVSATLSVVVAIGVVSTVVCLNKNQSQKTAKAQQSNTDFTPSENDLKKDPSIVPLNEKQLAEGEVPETPIAKKPTQQLSEQAKQENNLPENGLLGGGNAQNENYNDGNSTSISSLQGSNTIVDSANAEVAEATAHRKGIAAVSIKKILNYKVADYTNMRNNQWSSFSTELGGLAAPYENNEDREKAELDNSFTIKIAYMDYLTQCVEAMNTSKYAMAIEKLDVIAQQYPDDVNAQFYSARCLYESKEYEKAIGYYEKTLKNTIRTFNEEAEFYKGKSLKALGRNEEAKQIFLSIVKKEKFYAPQAAKELQ